MTTEDRRVGKLLPSPVTPATTVCFTIQIPNAVQYRAAFLGQLNILGDWHTWDHPTDGTVCTDCEEAAQLWRTAIYEATWSDECGDDMSCGDVADCIETDPGTQAAIDTRIDGKIAVPTTYPPGQPNPAPGGNLAGTTNPTCDLNVLWAQCLALTQQTNKAIIDVLQKIEVATNSVELIDSATEFPLVGWAKDALGGQVTLDLIQYYQEAVDEQYQAQYTETPGGVEDQLACALFCLCKADCEITIDRVYNLYKSRLEAYITIPTIDTLANLIDFAAGISQDNTIVVDLAFFFAWGSAKLGSFFFGGVFDTALELLLMLAVDDASADWELLCTECVEPDEWIKDVFTGGAMHSWEAVSTFAAFSNGWTDGAADDIQIGIKKLFTGLTVTAMRVYFDVGFTGAITAQSLGNYDASGFVQMTKVEDTMWEAIGMTRNAGIFLNFVNSPGITGHKIIEIWYKVA